MYKKFRKPVDVWTLIYKQEINGPKCMATVHGAKTASEAIEKWNEAFGPLKASTYIIVSVERGNHPLPA